MADEVIYKRPDEIIKYTYDFAPKLQSDAALSASAVTALDELGVAAPTTIGTVVNSGLNVTAPLKLGTDGHDYTITFQATGTTSLDKREWVVEMRVRNKIGGGM